MLVHTFSRPVSPARTENVSYLDLKTIAPECLDEYLEEVRRDDMEATMRSMCEYCYKEPAFAAAVRGVLEPELEAQFGLMANRINQTDLNVLHIASMNANIKEDVAGMQVMHARLNQKVCQLEAKEMHCAHHLAMKVDRLEKINAALCEANHELQKLVQTLDQKVNNLTDLVAARTC